MTSDARQIAERLSEAQRKALLTMPDWIGVGLPADAIGVPRHVLNRLCVRGFAEKERPNEEWPNVYAATPLGLEVRAILQEGPKTEVSQ